MVNISLIPIITYLSEKPYAIHAISILHEVAHRVESIMLKRGYKIGALCEFYPSSRLLGLNINNGQTILLRLRSSQDESEFLGVDDIVGTMLHELAHNVYKRHDVDFYRLLEEHMTEYAILRVAIQQRHEKLAMEAERLEKANGREGIVSISKPVRPRLAITTKKDITIKEDIITKEEAADSVATENKTEEAAAEQEALTKVLRGIGLDRHPVDSGEKMPGPTLLQWDCVYCTFTNIQCLTDCMLCGNSRL